MSKGCPNLLTHASLQKLPQSCELRAHPTTHSFALQSFVLIRIREWLTWLETETQL